MNPLRSLLIFLLLLPLPAAAQDVGVLTLVEGSPHINRGISLLQAGEGVRLRHGDIIESSASGFVQMELSGGTVIAIGPASRLYLLSVPASGRGAGAELVLLSGWLKIEPSGTGSAYRCVTPLLGASTRGGTVVLHDGGDSADLFVESGSAVIGEVGQDGSWRDTGAGKAGQFFSRRANRGVATQLRPTSAFVDAMPRPFQDTLPHRASRFAGKPVEPKRDHEVSYGEIQAWLTMPRAWRRGMVRRFEPRLNDPAFRKAVDAHMQEHPEWDPILHPEKYGQKAAPASNNPNPPNGSH